MGEHPPHPANASQPSAGDPAGAAARDALPLGFRLTPEGTGWLIVTGLVVGIGFFKSINLLLLLGYLLVVIVVANAVLAGRRLRGLRGRRRIAGPVFAGSPCGVEVHIKPSRPGGLPAVRVEDRGPAHALDWFTDRLEGAGEHSFRGEVVLPARGLYAWGPVTASSGYPFGLARRRVLLAPGEAVIVLPRLGRLHRGRLRRHLRGVDPRRDRTRQRPQRHPGAQAEFHGLRDYRAGDSPRLIHWRTSARCGTLMVREFEDLPGENLLLVFDPTLPPGADPAVFESALSLAATLCWEWGRRSGERLLLAVGGLRPELRDGLTTPSHVRRVLECLAVQEPTAATDPRALLAVLGVGRLPSAAVVVVGIGSNRLGGMLEQKLRRPVTYLNATAERFDFYEAP
jgi:uncharacterized protein (DUF58 family)